MKFGKTFVSHQVPEWTSHYMNYKELKKQIKVIVDSQKVVISQIQRGPKDTGLDKAPEVSLADTLNNESVQTALADFFFKIDRNIERVESFFNFQFAEYERRLKRVTTVIISNNKEGDKIEFDKEELEEVIGILIELRGNFRNLKWFGELNKRGFIKILKKLDKKTGTNKQMYYLSSRIFPLSFANETENLRVLNVINGYLSELSPQADELISLSDPYNYLNGNEPASNTSTRSGATARGYISPTSNRYAGFIRKNDGDALIKELVAEFRSPILAPSKLLVNLLNKSALAQSFDCIDKIMSHIQVLSDSSDISARNFFHHHVIALGKQTTHEREQNKAAETESEGNKENVGKNGEKANGLLIERNLSILPAAAPEPNFRLVGAFGSDGINSNDSPSSLEYILNKLPASLRPSLLQRDNYKRAPLHYAAQYGLKDTAKIIISFLKKWNQWDASVSIDDVNVWGDTEHLTPLHLSLVADHPKTTKILLDSTTDVPLTNPGLVLLVVRLKSPKLLDNLLTCKGIDVNYNKNDTKETALYIATKLNAVECVEFLLKHGADTELSELSFGWTPIFIAAAEGYTEVAQVLIKYGAEYSKVDHSGWLPMEHASLRGHLMLAEILRPADYDPFKLAKSSNLNQILKKESPSPASSSNNSAINSSADLKETLLDQESTSSIDKLPTGHHKNKTGESNLYKEIKVKGAGSTPVLNTHNHHQKPIKSFGHQFLKPGESLVLLTLGTTDLRDNSPAIQLNRVPIAKAHSTELDTALSVSISCKQLNQPPVVLDLPLDDTHGSATDPISFKFTNQDPSQATIYFDVVPTYSYGDVGNPKSELSSLASIANNYSSGNLNHVGFTSHSNNSNALVNIPFSNGKGNSGGLSKKRKVLGRGIALLNNIYTMVGNDRRSLNNVVTVPIIESDTLEELGTVRFEVMHVSNFIHPNMAFNINDSYWKTLITTRVIGHRGLGKNINSKSSLQLGENTVESFIAAASLGASYVEFDVQLTKDHVPVIYHDFLVAESGVDIPMHQLTAEQFLKLSEHRPHQEFSAQFLRDQRNASRQDPKIKGASLDDEVLIKSRKARGRASSLFGDASSLANYAGARKNGNAKEAESKLPEGVEGEGGVLIKTSDGDDEEGFSSAFDERMKLTKTYKEKKFKGNSRGTSIASSFVTLEELFKKLPESVGFNIECKYPMLEEVEKEGLEQIGVSLNRWVDVVLQTVYDHKKQRNIIFSSFHPDICIYLSLKQPAIPILFLTEGGSQFMADARASSLQAAIRFAKKWNLLGIVSAAAPIVQCPRLASVVKSNGLVCFTYGVLNNDPQNAKLEVEAGVDAVIVDKVLAVRKGLTIV